MTQIQERPPVDPVRRTRRFRQPDSTAALRPSQRRAATNRAAMREQRSAAAWLRRLMRP